MADPTIERLNLLQMNDLGTARREYISTADRNFRSTRLDIIETQRRSNVPGSFQQRTAEANRARLEGWATVHRAIGDTGDEQLDPMLDGQTHRLSLNARYNQSHEQVNQALATRSVSGRFREPNRPLAERITRPGSVTDQSRTVARPVARPSRAGKQDLSLPKPRARPASSAHNAPVLKTRRPVVSSTFQISSPEAFMAHLHAATPTNQLPGQLPVESPKTVIPTTAKIAPKGPPNSGEEPARQATSGGSPFSASTGKFVSTNLESSSGSGTKVCDDARPLVCSDDTTDRAKEEVLPDATRKDQIVSGENTAAASRCSKPQELLVDLSPTPTELEADPGLSPALAELTGLEFMQVCDKKSGEKSESETTVGSLDREQVEEYERDIRLICDLLERTSITDTLHPKLTECKVEMESRLQLLQRPLSGAESSQQQTVPQILEHSDPESVNPTVIVATPNRSRALSSLSQTSNFSQTRLNASAPQFTPKSFTQYRSLSDATSTVSTASLQPAESEIITQEQVIDDASDSTTIHVPVDTRSQTLSPEIKTTFPPSASGLHICGDHLLPGARSRASEMVQQSAPSSKSGDGDLFEQGANRTIGSYTAPVLPISHAVPEREYHPDPARQFSRSLEEKASFKYTSSSEALETRSSNTPVKDIASVSSPNRSALAPNAPLFEPAKTISLAAPSVSRMVTPTTTSTMQSIYAPATQTAVSNSASPALKPAETITPAAPSVSRKAAPTSMMQSIYAPAAQRNASNSTPEKKTPIGQGSTASRYPGFRWV
ncbi:hypothetical protein BJY04DRAFT_111019 [Aspergillus karnatakaensis]|uniref:uncharacterized protein n=1 Tax=Aspergillus karnatakaensis TaxID=1810916 RepID=UPI003CCCEEB8